MRKILLFAYKLSLFSPENQLCISEIHTISFLYSELLDWIVEILKSEVNPNVLPYR